MFIELEILRALPETNPVSYRNETELDSGYTVSGYAAATLIAATILTGLVYWIVGAKEREPVGFAIGAFGLIISLGGFGITIWQIGETRSASEEATRAVGNLRRDVKSLDVISEIHSVTTALSQALQSLKDGNWAAASDLYERVRNGLNKILAIGASSGIVLDEAQAKDFISHLIAAATELDTVAPEAAIDTSEMRTQLRLMTDFTVSLETQVRDKIGDY